MTDRKVRIIRPGPNQVQSMALHLASLQSAGHDVVFVTTNQPAADLRRRFADEGVDVDRVQFVDAVTRVAVHAEEDPNCLYLPSPTMLELIGMRCEQWASKLENPYIVVCCLNTMASYNGVDAVIEFSHYFASRMELRGFALDLILTQSNNTDNLLDRARGLADEMITLTP